MSYGDVVLISARASHEDIPVKTLLPVEIRIFCSLMGSIVTPRLSAISQATAVVADLHWAVSAARSW